VLEMAAQDSAVLAAFERKEFVAQKKVSWCNKRCCRGGYKNIVAQQKDGIVLNIKIS
jgi:hypothetical protein